jgi:hypothetical protein
MAAPLSIRVRAAVVRSVFALPRPARRLMAGPPVRIDGQELDLDAQLMIRLKNRSGSDVFAGLRKRPGRDTTTFPGSSATSHRSPFRRSRSAFPRPMARSRPPCIPPRTRPSRPGCWCITTAVASPSAHE